MGKHKASLKHLADMGNSTVSIFDFSEKKQVFYIANLATTLGYSSVEVENSKGHFLDDKVHPDDFLGLMQNGMLMLKLFLNFSEDEKMNHKLISEYRIRNQEGNYVRVIEQHQALELDGKGNLWLAMSLLDLSPNQGTDEGLKTQLLNYRTGKYLPIAPRDDIKVSLTSREKEILQLVKKGFLSKEISDQLSISLHTVNTYRQRILEKLGVNNSMEAVMLASRLGLV